MSFGLGPAWARNTQCCGKPVGCTNMSGQCLMLNHPWKRWHRETYGQAAMPGSEDRMATPPASGYAEALARSVPELRAQKDAAYAERDRLVAALSKQFPAHLARHEGADWEDDWRNIVCIHLPTGQATWHIHDSELPWFAHLAAEDAHWDGHSTEEKYRRLDALPPRRSRQDLRVTSRSVITRPFFAATRRA